MNLGTFGFGSGGGTPSGMISGAGTVPKIPKFTAANVIGDSQISDNGTTVFIGASATSASAVFEVNSTTQGVLFPRVTTAQRNAITVNAAANSLFVFNTTIGQYQYYDHTTTSWKTIDNGLDGIYSGSGIVPAGTTATITDYIAFNDGEFRTENGYWQGTSKILYINPNGTTANLFVGQGSGNSTMTGTDNTGLGLNTLLSNTTGLYNNAVGRNALASNTTGYGNNAFGYYALALNTTGLQNSAFGNSSLESNTTGTGNVAIGQSSLQSITTTGYNTAIGYVASQLNVSEYNTSIGAFAGRYTTSGSQNTFVGAFAGSTNTTGGFNTVLGYNSFFSNTTGDYNTVVGHNSLLSNTIGVRNSVVGADALKDNTTGTLNVAVGYGALLSNTTANSNTAIGVYSMVSNTTGERNVAVGYGAGYYETGSDKLFIDNRFRASEADGRAKALIYGIFDAAVANQRLNINASVGIGGGVANGTSVLNIANLPVSSVGLVTGDVWNNGGVLTIV